MSLKGSKASTIQLGRKKLPICREETSDGCDWIVEIDEDYMAELSKTATEVSIKNDAESAVRLEYSIPDGTDVSVRFEVTSEEQGMRECPGRRP